MERWSFQAQSRSRCTQGGKGHWHKIRKVRPHTLSACVQPVRTSSEVSQHCMHGRVLYKHFNLQNSVCMLVQNPTIDGNYVDGVSLTHGRPRQHVWTFAARNCSCPGKPSFVEPDHYFCDGSTELWHGCTASSNSCCSFNNPPWFYRQLSQPTTDDIEMRVCRDEDRGNEDIQIQAIDLYVQ
jgi:hypothetical protein